MAQQLEVYRTQRMDLEQAFLEFKLLVLDAPAHRIHHGSILAAQAAQLQHLVVQVAAADVDDPRRLRLQGPDAIGHGGLQQGLAAPHNLLGKRLLQRRQAAGLQQHIVARYLGDQRFLCRHGQHLAAVHPQHLRGLEALAVKLRLHLLARAERIPQRVDLVQHHQARRLVGTAGRAQMLVPDGQVRTRHAGVCAQDEHHCVRLGQQAQRQFRLCAHGIEPWRVHHHQPLAQQRVRQIDQRMAPQRHFHQTLRVGQRVFCWQIVVPETQRACCVHAHQLHLRHFLQRLRNLGGIAHFQRDLGPGRRPGAPLRQPLRQQACVNWQQPQAWGQAGIKSQFRGTHRGPPGTGRHDATTVVGKEKGVDEFGFAA